MIRQSNSKLNPSLVELIKLLSKVAVEDYLKEIEQPQEERVDGN